MKTDTGLQADVEAELLWDPRIDADGLLVSVRRGIVSLGGHVPSYAEKCAAECAAKKIAGVRALVNEIEVRPKAQRSDREIATVAIEALKATATVPVETIQVIVSDGWISLEGQVLSCHQRDGAEHALRNLWGIKGINNAIWVQPQLDAGDIWGDISSAFRRHAEIDAEMITVTVRDGTVTLTGFVRSWREREDAEKAAWAAPGVKDVKDELVVSVDITESPP